MKSVIDMLCDMESGPYTPCGVSQERLRRKVPRLLSLARLIWHETSPEERDALQSYQCMTRESCVSLIALGMLGLRGHQSDLLTAAELLCDELVRRLELKTQRVW